jgi:hypothetical protein
LTGISCQPDSPAMATENKDSSGGHFGYNAAPESTG